MKKLLLTLVVSVSLMFWGCNVLANSKVLFGIGEQKPNNESVIGLSLDEVLIEFGSKDFGLFSGGCSIPMNFDSEVVGVIVGDKIRYRYDYPQKNVFITYDLCIVENIVVAVRVNFNEDMSPENIRKLVLKPFPKTLKGPELEL